MTFYLYFMLPLYLSLVVVSLSFYLDRLNWKAPCYAFNAVSGDSPLVVTPPQPPPVSPLPAQCSSWRTMNWSCNIDPSPLAPFGHLRPWQMVLCCLFPAEFLGSVWIRGKCGPLSCMINMCVCECVCCLSVCVCLRSSVVVVVVVVFAKSITSISHTGAIHICLPRKAVESVNDLCKSLEISSKLARLPFKMCVSGLSYVSACDCHTLIWQLNWVLIGKLIWCTAKKIEMFLLHFVTCVSAVSYALSYVLSYHFLFGNTLSTRYDTWQADVALEIWHNNMARVVRSHYLSICIILGELNETNKVCQLGAWHRRVIMWTFIFSSLVSIFVYCA